VFVGAAHKMVDRLDGSKASTAESKDCFLWSPSIAVTSISLKRCSSCDRMVLTLLGDPG
jgi:hypothetical protein